MVQKQINSNEEGVKNLFFDKETLENDFEGLMTSLTDIEQGVIKILYEKKHAMTMSKIRGLLVDAYFHYLIEFYEENTKKRINNLAEKSIKWRPNLELTFLQAEKVMQGITKKMKERGDKALYESQRLKEINDVMINNGIILPSRNLVNSSLINLKRMGLVSFRYVIPTNSLNKEDFNKKDRYQREIWFLNPKFYTFLKKL